MFKRRGLLIHHLLCMIDLTQAALINSFCYVVRYFYNFIVTQQTKYVPSPSLEGSFSAGTTFAVPPKTRFKSIVSKKLHTTFGAVQF